MCGAGRVPELGRDRGQDRFDPCPMGRLAPTHDRRAMARALFSARDADTKERALQRLHPAHRVAEIGVTCVDDEVIGGQMRIQRLDLSVYRRTGGHHQQDSARRFERVRQRLQRLAGHNAVGQITGLFHKRVRLRYRAVEHRDRKTLFRDVEREGRAHRTQPDQSNIRFCHDAPPPSFRLTCASFCAKATPKRKTRPAEGRVFEAGSLVVVS